MVTPLEQLAQEYDQAETAFLNDVRDGMDRAGLAKSARAVASAASAFNAQAYRQLHSGEEDAWMPLDLLTERTEVLEELWGDLASAYEQ